METLGKRLEKTLDTYSFRVSPRLYQSISPNSAGWWELDLEPLISDRNIRMAAEKEVMEVLVTTFDRPVPEGRSIPADYMPITGEKVLEPYNQEYRVEMCFIFKNSGVGIYSVFLQTPSRVNAMMFVISIAVSVSNIIANAMFRLEDTRLKGRAMTMYDLVFEL